MADTIALCVSGIINKAAGREEPQTKQPLQSGDRVIALVNNLGATPLSELYGVYNRLTTRCQQAGLIIERNLIGGAPHLTGYDRFLNHLTES
ncbi:dihydroxyacetone kinase subunit DhaK [Escherichia coli]